LWSRRVRAIRLAEAFTSAAVEAVVISSHLPLGGALRRAGHPEWHDVLDLFGAPGRKYLR
jgi:hypothetical protein